MGGIYFCINRLVSLIKNGFRKEHLIKKISVVFLLQIVVGCGSGSDSSPSIDENILPTIFLTDFDVLEGDNVNLTAQVSDSDGQIASYLWEQISGVTVDLINVNTASASFIAPQVDMNVNLVFRLTVTDNLNAASSEQITVTVVDSISEELFFIAGSVNGLNGTVELALNENEVLTIDQNGEFQFTTQLNKNDNYTIQINTQPQNQLCDLENGSGIVEDHINDVIVSCQNQVVNACNDGIDNDNDGLIDWHYDLGCTSQSDNSEGGIANLALENGWSVLEPSVDTRIYYVSSSEGDDNNNGLSPSSPFKTFSRAKEQARNNFPDWILLKRGDEFFETIEPNSGRSVNEPFVVSSYGNSVERPLIKAGSQTGISFETNFEFIAIVGLDFYAHTRNPNDPSYVNSDGGYGFRIWRQENTIGRNILIENCAFRYFVLSVIQGPSSPEEITLRRNLIEYSYATNSHSQGIYSQGVVDLIFEENIMDHNGWLIQSYNEQQDSGQATKFNHNTYFNSINGLSYQRNAIMRGSSMGSKFTAQTHANSLNISHNLYLDNEIGIGMGQNYQHLYRFEDIIIEGNVFTNMGQSRPTNRTLGWAIQLDGLSQGRVQNNTIINSLSTNVENTFAFELYPNLRNVTVDNNIAYDLFADNNRGMFRLYEAASQEGLSLTNNQLISPTSQRTLVEVSDFNFENIFLNGNQYYSNRNVNTWFEVNNIDIDFTEWLLQTGEVNASSEMPNYCDSSRTIEAYQAFIDQEPNLQTFIDNIKQQQKYNWNDDYNVLTINQWLADGYAICEP